MYRVTEEIAKYLSENTKSPDVPGLVKTDNKPFLARNVYSIGYVNEAFGFNTDALYVLELDLGTRAFFLYKKGELKRPDDSIEVKRAGIDPHSTNLEEMIDIADCVVELPPQMDKLTSKSITTLDRLLELEPEIQKCLLTEEAKREREKGFGI